MEIPSPFYIKFQLNSYFQLRRASKERKRNFTRFRFSESKISEKKQQQSHQLPVECGEIFSIFNFPLSEKEKKQGFSRRQDTRHRWRGKGDLEKKVSAPFLEMKTHTLILLNMKAAY